MASPDLFIDGFVGNGRQYVFFAFSDEEIIAVALRFGLLTGVSENSMDSEIDDLIGRLQPFNQRQRAIKNGAESLDVARKLSPVEFEAFIAEALKRHGWSVSLTKASGDSGVDVIALKKGQKAIVQCKKWKKVVGEPAVRDLCGAMMHEGADRAFLVTTSSFSKAARQFAAGKPIELVDQYGLMEWMGRT